MVKVLFYINFISSLNTKENIYIYTSVVKQKEFCSGTIFMQALITIYKVIFFQISQKLE